MMILDHPTMLQCTVKFVNWWDINLRVSTCRNGPCMHSAFLLIMFLIKWCSCLDTQYSVFSKNSRTLHYPASLLSEDLNYKKAVSVFADPKCNDTDFPYGKFQCVSDKTGTPTSTPSPSPSSPTLTPPVVLPSSHSQPTTPIMATSPVTQVCSTTTVVYTTAVQQAATVTINPTQCQCATTLPVINSTISFNSTIKESSGGPQSALQTGNPDKTELSKLIFCCFKFLSWLCSVW